jgi:hypothetical protein
MQSWVGVGYLWIVIKCSRHSSWSSPERGMLFPDEQGFCARQEGMYYCRVAVLKSVALTAFSVKIKTAFMNVF